MPPNHSLTHWHWVIAIPTMAIAAAALVYAMWMS
jgi:hypothetical protein